MAGDSPVQYICDSPIRPVTHPTPPGLLAATSHTVQRQIAKAGRLTIIRQEHPAASSKSFCPNRLPGAQRMRQRLRVEQGCVNALIG